MVVKVRKWEYCRPAHIPDGVTEFVHPCGCKEYEEEGVWLLKQCPRHERETNDLIKRFQKEIK